MTTPADDLKTLMSVGALKDGEFIDATPCVRLDFLVTGPLVQRPGTLDPLLEKCAALMDGQLKLYASEGPFAYSRRKKVTTKDLGQLGRFTSILEGALAEDEKEIQEDLAAYKEMGMNPDPKDFVARDSGNLLFTDALPLSESGSHILFIGTLEWRVSLSFSLELYEQKKLEILSLASDIFSSGVPQTGNFGFSYNTGSVAEIENDARRTLRPLTQRFRLLNIIEPGALQFTDVTEDKVGLYPIGSWTYIDTEFLERFRVGPRKIDTLKEKLFAVEQFDHGVLFKLTEEPTLGDLNADADLSAAFALGGVLKSAMEQSELGGLEGLRVGASADRWAHYLRFARAK